MEKGIRISFLLLVFFLPLVLSIRSSEVFELPKMLLVYAMTAVIVGLWLMRMVMRREILIRRTPLDVPILLFLISQMVSTIYSIDPSVSWWGWYGRFNGGLWSTVSYTLLYYAFVANISENSENSESQKVRNSDNQKAGASGSLNLRFSDFSGSRSIPSVLIFAFLASATVVSIYAILQHFGIDKDFWVQDVVNRVFSTQGQPNWLAAYLVMAIPLAFAMTISEIINHKSYMISYFLFLIYALALLWTKSRSGLVGLAITDIVFWGLLILKGPTLPRQGRTFIKPLLLAHCFLLLLIFLTSNPVRDALFRKVALQTVTVPALEGTITIRKSAQGGTESGDIRRIVWNGAIQLVKQRPVFGFGPETFGETYWRVRPKEHNLTSEWNFLYNKAHNEWLNLAANTGIFGLVSHLLLLGWLSVWVLKGPALPRQGRALSCYAILAGLWGVEIVNFFGFSTVTVGVYRYLFMGMAIVSASEGRILKGVSLKTGRLPFTVYCLLFTVVLAILYLLSQLFIFFLADLAYNRGRAYQDAGYIEEAVESLTQTVNLAPGEPVFRAELAEAEGMFASLINQKSDIINHKDELINRLEDDSLANFEIVRKQSPQNLGFIRTQARILFLLGEQDKAVQLMKAAMTMAPTNPQLPYSLGQMLSKMGNEEEAAVYYNKALELKPDYQEAKKILNSEY